MRLGVVLEEGVLIRCVLLRIWAGAERKQRHETEANPPLNDRKAWHKALCLQPCLQISAGRWPVRGRILSHAQACDAMVGYELHFRGAAPEALVLEQAAVGGQHQQLRVLLLMHLPAQLLAAQKARERVATSSAVAHTARLTCDHHCMWPANAPAIIPLRHCAARHDAGCYQAGIAGDTTTLHPMTGSWRRHLSEVGVVEVQPLGRPAAAARGARPVLCVLGRLHVERSSFVSVSPCCYVCWQTDSAESTCSLQQLSTSLPMHAKH